MPKSVPKVAPSRSRDIPFNHLVLSQANIHRIKAGVSIEELAENIARRTLLQSLTVRPILDDEATETGLFEVPTGGRRFRALELLIKLKRLARTAPIPCMVRTEGLAEEDSLAENVQRASLPPLVGDLANNLSRSLYVRLHSPDQGKAAAGQWSEDFAPRVMLRICGWVLCHRRSTALTQHNASAVREVA